MGVKGIGREGNGEGRKGKRRERERKGEGREIRTPPSDRSGYGPELVTTYAIITPILPILGVDIPGLSNQPSHDTCRRRHNSAGWCSLLMSCSRRPIASLVKLLFPGKILSRKFGVLGSFRPCASDLPTSL